MLNNITTIHLKVEFWTDSMSCGRNLYGGLVLLSHPTHSPSSSHGHPNSAYPTNEELNNLNFSQNSKLLIIANDSNGIRHELNI